MKWGVLAAGVILASCSDEPSSHIFSGRLYEQARNCVDPTTSVDVADGPEPTTPCDPVCFLSPLDPDASGPNVYVSTMCAPYPYGFDTSGTSPECVPALAAYNRNDTCEDDGGTTAPIVDAGTAVVADATHD